MSEKGEKLNPFQHALKRPEIYIGSIKTIYTDTWIVDENNHIVFGRVKYNAGLIKIFEEILSNAIDNKWRSEKHSIEMKNIIVNLDKTTNKISVMNDGYCIPVEQYEYEYTDPITSQLSKNFYYPAELFFGHMLTGTNYEDSLERKTSGTFGLGGKIANVFSKEFIVEHTSLEHKKKFFQKYENNARVRFDPEITKYNLKKGYTKIEFLPDYERFGYDGIDDDLISIVKLKVYNCAMITGLNVSFNDEKIKNLNLQKYVELYFTDNKLLYLTNETNDEFVAVEVLDKDDSLPNHISFVNGTFTKGGGVHIDGWKNAFAGEIVKAYNLKQKKDDIKITAKDIIPYFVFFVKCELDKPSFDSQTKERLLSPVPIIPKPDEKNIKKVMKWDFIGLFERKFFAKVEKSIERKENKKIKYGSKAEDASNAGGKNSASCVLFITEGLSAKALAISGISAIRSHTIYGVLAVRGKFMNVLNATLSEINNNEEIVLLKSMLGLKCGVDYISDSDFGTLRYGKVCIMTDADDDGIHIRGLLMNFFYAQYNGLCQRGFVQSFSTPVIKVYLKDNTKVSFYCNSDFKRWNNTNKQKLKNTPKYYKGLGSFKTEDAKELFSDMKVIKYECESNDEEKKFMNLGFNSKCTDDRKKWILKNLKKLKEVSEDEIDDNFTFEGVMKFSYFIDKQLINYHTMSIYRCIPSLIDGFKESQRKVFYGIRLKNPKETITVNKIAGIIGETSSYHHGETSLQNTIIGMAQGFVGSNNIPLLVNDGMFGTRMEGGDDKAAARYISTKLEKISHLIYREEDNDLLEYQYEGNDKIEPVNYIPIIPMVLVNGADGIASGFQTSIPTYNPEDLVEWILNKLSGDKQSEEFIKPWFRGFYGGVELNKTTRSEKFSYTTVGIINKLGDCKYEITEAPINIWTSKLKDFIENNNEIIKIENLSSTNKVHFVLKTTKDFSPDISPKGNMSILTKTRSLGNMVLLDRNKIPTLYSTPEDILEEFYSVRFNAYTQRKAFLLNNLNCELDKEKETMRFIVCILDKTLKLDIPEKELLVELKKLKFKDTEYLLNLPIRSLTQKKYDTLKEKINNIQTQINGLKEKNEKELWEDDLYEFITEYNKFLVERQD